MSGKTRPFHLTLIHPCVGRRMGMRRYIRTWLMEPLPPATIAALTPPEVTVVFHDDRLEPIPFDAPTDLVAISVETYTAKRAYQIASDFRRRGVPVVMGGFHATLCPDEVGHYADSVIIGEAEALWPQVLDDWRHGRGQRVYRAAERPSLARVHPDRSIYAGKRYLPITLVETARGCRFRCEFCAIQSAFGGTQNRRPVDLVVDEIHAAHRPGRLVFIIDDNVVSDPAGAKELFRALAPLRIRWVGQASIDAAWDDELLALMRASGCQGVLVGFESLEADDLKRMNKGFNLARGGPAAAMAAFRRHGLRVYGTFVIGYDHDSAEAVRRRVAFARDEGLFIAAFNHLTPFPGTPLYDRLWREDRLTHAAWWLDPAYRYNDVPYRPVGLSPAEIRHLALEARREFYGWSSIARRALQRQHWRDPFMWFHFLAINAMHRWDVSGRDGLPLGDAAWSGRLLEV